MSSGDSAANGGCAVLGAAAATPVGLVFMVVIMMGGGRAVPPPSDCVPTGGESGLGLGPLRTEAVPQRFVPLVLKAGQRCAAFPAPVIAAQIQAESGWNPNAVSSAGAMGIAQFMPSTWAVWGHGSPFDPAAAIAAQARYDCSLAKTIKNWKQQGRIEGNVTKLALAAYNAGLGAVAKYGGIPPYPQTQTYVPKVMKLARGRFSQGGPAGGAVQQAGCTGGGEGRPPVPVPATGKARVVVQAALSWRGVPYVWGGGNYSGPTQGGFDCSGLVVAAYHRVGINLPRTAAAQYRATSEYQIPGGFNPAKYKPGDLLFWGSSPTSIHHVAIAIGNGKLIEAPHPGAVVSVRPIYKADFFAATRPLARNGGQ